MNLLDSLRKEVEILQKKIYEQEELYSLRKEDQVVLQQHMKLINNKRAQPSQNKFGGRRSSNDEGDGKEGGQQAEAGDNGIRLVLPDLRTSEMTDNFGSDDEDDDEDDHYTIVKPRRSTIKKDQLSGGQP